MRLLRTWNNLKKFLNIFFLSSYILILPTESTNDRFHLQKYWVLFFFPSISFTMIYHNSITILGSLCHTFTHHQVIAVRHDDRPRPADRTDPMQFVKETKFSLGAYFRPLLWRMRAHHREKPYNHSRSEFHAAFLQEFLYHRRRRRGWMSDL